MGNTIANEIYRQIGGKRLSIMTGAKNFIASEDGLSFRLPGTMTKNRINVVRITLNPSDTYKVEFGALRGSKYKVVSTHDGVYNDSLMELFRQETGLETRMPTILFR